MSKLEELINQYCPDGVGWKTIGETCEVLTGGEAPEDSIKSKKPQPPYIYPIFSNGIGDNALWGFSKQYRVDRKAVTFSSIGTIGYPTVRKEKFTPVIRLKTIYPKDESTLSLQYLKYALEIVDFKNHKSSIPNINADMLKNIEIPVPPLPVQEEIVRILDKFAELEEELEEELQLRKKQYEYYRDKMLSLSDYDGEVKTMGALGKFYGGITGKAKADFENGNAKFISYMNVYSNIAVNQNATDTVKIGKDEKQKTLQYCDVCFTGSSETPDECGMSSVVVEEPSEALYLNSFSFFFRFDNPEKFNPHFLKHLFRCHDLRYQIGKTANGVTRFNVSKEMMKDVKIPLLDLDEQERIADILDKFDSLVTDISEGLPAEIKMRRQQYEYYRDKLLNFKRLENK